MSLRGDISKDNIKEGTRKTRGKPAGETHPATPKQQKRPPSGATGVSPPTQAHRLDDSPSQALQFSLSPPPNPLGQHTEHFTIANAVSNALAEQLAPAMQNVLQQHLPQALQQ